ncbi:MAG: hypothetical protein AB4911_23690 [Oscillochloridaceae bacterium umkhey_bin13]
MSQFHPHLSFATLADLADGLPLTDPAIPAHLATCSRCADDLHWLQYTSQLLRAEPLETPPAHASARARALFRQVRTAAPGPARPLLGLLRFDSWKLGQLALVRTTLPYQERQLIYQTGPYILDLRLNAEEAGWELAGQILGSEATLNSSGRVVLRGPEGQATTAISELYEFRLPPVAPGLYTLAIATGDDALVIPDLYLGEDAA